MKLTDEQIESSLVALRRRPPVRMRRRAGSSTHDVPLLAADVQLLLRDVPAVRADVVDRVRLRMSEGQAPTDAEVARHLVGRLVCERLR